MADPSDLVLESEPAADRASLAERLLHRRYRADLPDPDAARARAAQAAEASGASLWHVAGPGGRRGHVWLAADGDALVVLDVTLADRSTAPAVRALVEARARAEGARRVAVVLSPGDLVTECFVEGGGFAVVSAQMRLDLDGDLPPEPDVELAPMPAERFDAWREGLLVGYAREQVAAGTDPERARRDSEAQVRALLPDGPATEHQHLFVGRAGGADVGVLWLATDRPMVFVYDVEVDARHRGHGYGAGIMRAAAWWARERGAPTLGLNVFGPNHVARSLYDRLGYLVTELSLARTL